MPHSRFLLLVLGLYLTAPAPAVAQDGSAPLAADLILKNGKIWTVNPQQPEAAALALRGDRIIAIGRMPKGDADRFRGYSASDHQAISQ